MEVKDWIVNYMTTHLHMNQNAARTQFYNFVRQKRKDRTDQMLVLKNDNKLVIT